MSLFTPCSFDLSCLLLCFVPFRASTIFLSFLLSYFFPVVGTPSSFEIMSVSQKVKECTACGQGFDEGNNEVGRRIGGRACADGHDGPFVRIVSGMV